MKSKASKYVLLFTITYFVSYITRINYGAIISEMERDTQISRSLLSMALTGSFITYGAGQIVSGICGDKFSPKKLVTCGLSASVLMNILIPLCTSPFQMLAVWCCNGFAQAFMWPPMLKLMTALLTEDEYKKGIAKVSMGSSAGTIVVYLCSPLLISFWGWKSVFLFSAAFGILMIVLWSKYCHDVSAEDSVVHAPKTADDSTTENGSGQSVFKVLFSPVLICVMLAIVLQGMLRDGVTTWMPSFISETYNLSNRIGILTGVIMPIFSIFCFQVVTRLYRKKFTNPALCGGLIFGVGLISSLMLVLLNGQSAAVSVVLSALLTGSMHGVNLMLVCMIPSFFSHTGKVSTVSGVLNACTYVGSALSTYGIALLSETLGWGFTLLSWLALAVAGTALCLVAARLWKRIFPKT